MSLKKESKECFHKIAQDIVLQIMQQPDAFFFFKPVDPDVDCAPGYFAIVTRPMSLFLVQQKLDNMEYNDPQEFIDDMHLIWQNAKSYNLPTTSIYKTADTLSRKFDILASSLPHYLSECEKESGIQKLIELRFLRYRMNKKTHL